MGVYHAPGSVHGILGRAVSTAPSLRKSVHCYAPEQSAAGQVSDFNRLEWSVLGFCGIEYIWISLDLNLRGWAAKTKGREQADPSVKSDYAQSHPRQGIISHVSCVSFLALP